MRIAAYAVLVVTAIILSGCASSPNDHPVTFATQSFGGATSAVTEYDQAAKTHPLPAGQTYPDPSFAKNGDSYESGYGTSEALRIWFCAWGKQYLTTQGVDDSAASASLDEFAKFLATDTFKQYYDPVSAQPLFKNAVDNAKLGDPSGVQTIVTGSCS